MSSTWRRLYVHRVWATKHRLPAIDPVREALIGKRFQHSARNQECEMLAFGAVADHVHRLVSLHTTASVAKLVRSMKSATTTPIERDDRRDPPFGWQTGHAALSVEPNDAAGLRAYLEHPKEHHSNGTTRAEWEPPLEALEEGTEPTTAPSRSEAAPAKSPGRRRG